MFAIPVIPSPDPVNEYGCFQDDLSGCCFLEERVDTEGLDIFAPVAPVFFYCVIIRIHNAICDFRPRRFEITAVAVTLSRQNTFQCCFCDSGK